MSNAFIMEASSPDIQQNWARIAGLSILGTIIVGIVTSIYVSSGIDINLNADVSGTAENMLGAETRLRAKAYLALLVVGLEIAVCAGLYLLLRRYGPALAISSAILNILTIGLTLFGAVMTLNAAEIASNTAYLESLSQAERLTLASLQATSDYTSFHLGLIITSLGNAGFFYLFLKSGMIPKFISIWGVFASLFVAVAIVARDFIPALGSNMVTGAFMICNLLALVMLGIYLGFFRLRQT